MARKLAHPQGAGLAAILLCFAAAGCSSYRAISPPDPGAAFSDGTAMRIELHNGEQVTLWGLTVDADSVRGRLDGKPYAVARERVVGFERSQISAGKTALLGVASILVVWGLLAWQVAAQGGI